MTAGSQAVHTLSPAAAPALERRRAVEEAIERAVRNLVDRQAGPGYWAGELEADATLESDYILLELWRDPPAAGERWRPRRADQVREAAAYIRTRQTASGGWSLYPGGPDELSGTVKAYFALKLAGDAVEAPHMSVARQVILSLGGLEKANSYTRIYLSFFGLWDRAKVPAIPPELILLPPEAYINIYEMSSWTRAIVIPLAVLCALRPAKRVPAGFTLAELLRNDPVVPAEAATGRIFWKLDRALRWWEKTGLLPLRRQALRAAERWMLERMETSDGLAAIFPAMLNSILALRELGYDDEHPALARAIRKFEELAIRERGTLRMQPCLSPVWDTALAAFALGEAGAGGGARNRAADWLLTKEARRRGDWSVKNRNAEPGGWYFEFANEYYPDIDDTAMVLLALRHAQASDPKAQRAAERRALDWMLSMQGRDGGWAAFDRDNDRRILNHVPFADHNAMLDPACPDITGRVLEAVAPLALPADSPIDRAVRRAVGYLRKAQEPDGSWTGRWGVNYIYGTCFALRGLRAAGVDPREACVLQAAEWIRSIQNADGGWGETCGSYDNPALKGCGASTPSQTAWALLALLAGGDAASGSVERGVRYLLDTQTADGAWRDAFYTGTGFPRVFYLKYHLYAHYFPLLALAEYDGAPR